MSKKFRIATFNLETFDDRDREGLPFAARLAVLRPKLAALAADILCLQEIDGQELEPHRRGLRALDTLLQETPYAGFHRATSELRVGHGPADKHNLVTLSRFPFISVHSVRHDFVPPPQHRWLAASPKAGDRAEVRWERPILHTAIGLPGGVRLDVLNLHLRAPLAAFVPGGKLSEIAWTGVQPWAEGFYLSVLKRAGQALEARLLVDKLLDADPAARIVVAGDLNADVLEMPIRLLRADVADTGNGLLANRMLEPAELRLPAEQRYTVLYGGRKVMLDHLLISAALSGALSDVDALNGDLADEALSAAAGRSEPGSFHAPLVATVGY